LSCQYGSPENVLQGNKEQIMTLLGVDSLPLIN